MATTTITCNKDSSTGHDDTYGDVGAGTCGHLPVGYAAFLPDEARSFLGFPTPSWSTWTAITAATLYMKTSSGYHIGSGNWSDPDVYIDLIVASWSEGSAGETWSASNAIVHPGPSCDGANRVTWDVGGSDNSPNTNTWYSVSVLGLIQQAWNNGAGTFYGLRLIPVTGGSGGDRIEFQSTEGGSAPYIEITYLTNTSPNAPTGVTIEGQASGATISTSDTLYRLQFTGSDPDAGDTCDGWDYELDTTTGNGVTPDWASLAYSGYSLTSDMVGFSINSVRTWTLTGAQWYAIRVRTRDEGNTNPGAWSSTYYFRANAAPTVSPLTPANGTLGVINNMSDATLWTATGQHAGINFYWSFNSSTSTQASSTVRIYDAATAGNLLSTQTQNSSSVVRISSYLLKNGDQQTYWWTIQATDALGQSSAESARQGFKVRWGQVAYETQPTGGASSYNWQFSKATMPANTRCSVLYGSGASPGTGGVTWYSTIGSVTPNTYAKFLVRLTTDVSGSQPQLADMTFTYTGTAELPDKWTVYSGGNPSTEWVRDESVRKFGTASFKCAANTTSYTQNRYAFPFRVTSGDDVPVSPSTTYTLSAWVKTQGDITGGGYCRVGIWAAGSLGSALSISAAVGDSSQGDGGWEQVQCTYTTGDTEVAIRPMIHFTRSGAGGVKTFWFDGIKLEEGSVATGWSPSFITDAAILDGYGVRIDADEGGIFRLQGSAAGAYDVVELVENGLRFGPADTGMHVYSDSAGSLRIDRDDLYNGNSTVRVRNINGGASFIAEGGGGNPRVGVRWYGDTADRVALDVNMEALRYTDGTTLRHELYRGFMDVERIGSYSALGDGGIPRVIVRNLDQSILDTNVLTNVTGMSFPALASTRYYVRWVIPFIVSSATTDGIQFAVTGPTGAVPWLNVTIPTSATARTFGRINALGTAVSTASIDSTTAINIATIEGTISISSTAGTVYLQAASDTATTGDVYLKAGMQLWIT